MIQERLSVRTRSHLNGFRLERHLQFLVFDLETGSMVFSTSLDRHHFLDGLNLFPNLNEMNTDEIDNVIDDPIEDGVSIKKVQFGGKICLSDDCVPIPKMLDQNLSVEIYGVTDSQILWENGENFYLADYLISESFFNF